MAEDPLRDVAYLGSLNGLLQLDLENYTWSNLFPDHKTLSNTQVYSVFIDDQSRIWFSANQKIWSYDKNSGTLLKYGEKDGLESSQFVLFANLRSADGRHWLGTDKGIVGFLPQHIQPYPFLPHIQLQALTINNEAYLGSPVINEREVLTLDYHQNTLVFDVVGISHYLPEEVEIHYQLKGYDKEQQISADKGQSEIRFYKLPENTYELIIFGVNPNGVKGEERRLKIVIHPPFWKTPQFMIFSFLAALGIGYMIFQLILKRKLRQQQIVFEALQHERNRIASEMHDDLGGGLYSIRILIQGILGKVESNDTSTKLNKIESKATELVENMREIIWAMDSSNDNLPELIAYIRKFVVEYFDNHELNCKAGIPPDLPDITISGDKRRHIFLSIKECSHNIVKHANATQIHLDFSRQNGTLSIQLKDNGIGIDTVEKNKFGNGLKNMKKRMEHIGGDFRMDTLNGTIVTFDIPLHN
ncbi:MAG: histidine kinase, partial [Bacteroidota bacterium]